MPNLPPLPHEALMKDLIEAAIAKDYKKAASIYIHAVNALLPSEADFNSIIKAVKKINKDILKEHTQQTQGALPAYVILMQQILKALTHYSYRNPQLTEQELGIIRISLITTPEFQGVSRRLATAASSNASAQQSRVELDNFSKDVMTRLAKEKNVKPDNLKDALLKSAIRQMDPAPHSSSNSFFRVPDEKIAPPFIDQDKLETDILSEGSKEQKKIVRDIVDSAHQASVAQQAGSSASHQRQARAAASSSKNTPPTVRRRSSSTDSFASSDSDSDTSASSQRGSRGR